MQTVCTYGAMLGLFECESPISSFLQVNFSNHVSEYGLSFATQDEYNFRMNEYAKKRCND